jgi:putative ABC transport system ATP-binding protein
LLADEPTGNLDPKTGAAVLDLLFELREQSAAEGGRVQNTGSTLVIVTHDERVASRADRRIRLEAGKIVSEERAR